MSVLNKPVKPYSFVDGTGNLAYGSEVNADFDIIYNKVGDVIDVVNTTDYQTLVNTAQQAITAEALAQDWASKSDGIVDATDYSAKAYAIGGTGVSGAAGAAKEWAIKTDAAVDGSEYSAKYYAQAAAQVYDSFDDRYLGAKAADPTLDNDGDALVAGALYFNTTSNVMRAYTGSEWQDNNAVADGSVTLAKLARVGTAGQVLTSGGAGADPSYQDAAGGVQIQPITASVASSALTIGSGALSLSFRSTTLGDGTVTTVTGTPAAIVVPSGATLGTVNAVQNHLVVIAMNNAGTIELAVVNLAGGNNLDETTLISTTALSAASDSANVVYSTTARTNLPFRVVGLVQSTQATAGTWATAPSLIQGAGGQAIASLGSLGYGQTWQDVVASRAVGTTYYNTTGKPIAVSVRASSSATSGYIVFDCKGVVMAFFQAYAAGAQGTVFGIVPPGASYLVTQGGGTAALVTWAELR